MAQRRRNPNSVSLDTEQEYRATLTRFSAAFYERNIGTDAQPVYIECRKSEPGAIPRLRAYARFTDVTNRDGDPLELATTMKYSYAERSSLTILLAKLADVSFEEIVDTKPDPNSFAPREVLVRVKRGRNRKALLAGIRPATEANTSNSGTAA